MPSKPKQKPEESKLPVQRVQTRDILHEMRESYLTYAMSVIIARALPDVRDGLKPVQRRILFAMHELGLRHSGKTMKSARVVGETMGKYHPHGDVALYDSLVRLAQPFSLRYPLVIGQGNFGSIDGDSPAAQRYTEAKMAAFAEELLADIEKDTVEFTPNYDNTKQEPKVLPSRLPNLLVNGSVGIAVGMATSIPPHNVGEIIDALRHLLKYQKATTADLLQFVKGPDFPTGGIIFNKDDIAAAYSTGKGSLLCRGRAEIIERTKRGSGTGDFDIVISEIPYEVNKATLVARIAELVEEKKVEGIKDIRDESDKQDMVRVVVELKPGAQAHKILNQLYKFTDLEKKYHMNMIALVDGIQPQTLSLKDILEEFLKHRRTVVVRRTQFDLARTKDRIHILEGLVKAIDHIDEIIKTIRASESRDAAKQNLIKKFKLSDRQADAILAIRLDQLARLEREKLHAELLDKQKYAKELQGILDNPLKVIEVIDTELGDMKKQYGDPRKTEIKNEQIVEVKEEELIPEGTVVVTLSSSDYIRRLNPEGFRVQKRGGRGVAGFESKSDSDAIKQVVSCSTHATLLFFTDTGKVFFMRPYDLPESTRVSRGKPINNFLNIASDERVMTFIPYHQGDKQSIHLVLVTEQGVIKKIEMKDLMERQRSGVRVLTTKKGDRVIASGFSSGKDDVMLVTKNGQIIRFPESQLRAQGRQAIGIKGMALKEGDQIVGMGMVSKDKEKTQRMMVLTEKGFGKMTPVREYRIQKRGGSGIKTAKVTDKTGHVVAAKILETEEELIVVSKQGQTIRMGLDAIKEQGRDTQGVSVMKLESGDSIISATCI